MAENKTKIDIFSGFLGAGKTTLIKKLIKEAFAGEKIVLIENEFGEIGIDGGFMREAGIQVNELNSGCICCSLVGDFREALKKVVETYHPDRILIEPSGVGKLSDVTRAVEGVAETLPVLLNSFVTVADVNKVKMYMKNFGEFYDDQVSHASCIILSRTGNAGEDKVAAAVALLAEKNHRHHRHHRLDRPDRRPDRLCHGRQARPCGRAAGRGPRCQRGTCRRGGASPPSSSP